MELSRRRFVTGVAAVGAGAGLWTPVRAGTTRGPLGDHAVFSSGVASGDPATDSVVLWTRLSDRFHGADVRWEVYADDDPTRTISRGTATAAAERDGTVHVPVDGLPPVWDDNDIANNAFRDGNQLASAEKSGWRASAPDSRRGPSTTPTASVRPTRPGT